MNQSGPPLLSSFLRPCITNVPLCYAFVMPMYPLRLYMHPYIKGYKWKYHEHWEIRMSPTQFTLMTKVVYHWITHTNMHRHNTHTHKHTYTHTRTHTYAHAHSNTHTQIHTYTHARTHIHTEMCTEHSVALCVHDRFLPLWVLHNKTKNVKLIPNIVLHSHWMLNTLLSSSCKDGDGTHLLQHTF